MDINNDIVTQTSVLSGPSTSTETSLSFFNMTLFRYVLIILILAFLLFNIVTYLGVTPGYFKSAAPMPVSVPMPTGGGGIHVLEKKLSSEGRTKNRDALPKHDYNPIPNDSGSHAKSGAGFCYIGEDRGFRSCINVGEGDVCMSGDIFPSMAKCINPSLR